MVALQDCVPDALERLLRRQPLSDAKVRFAWDLAVGPALARATGVALQPEGILEVTTATEHWKREVDRAAALIASRLTRLLGRDIVRKMVVRSAAAGARRRT